MLAMRGINFLERHEKAFEVISELTEETFNEFLAVLTGVTKASPVVSIDVLSSRIAEKVNSVKKENILEILSTLMNLYALLLYNPKIKVGDLIENVQQSIEEYEYSDGEGLKANISILKNRLAQLLDIDSLRTIVKAVNLLRENTNTFSNARTITDVRPIFDAEVETNSIDCVILNTLKLSYVTNGELQEFFISMDDSDINLLIKVLDRAKNKTNALKSLLKDTKLSCVNVE